MNTKKLFVLHRQSNTEIKNFFFFPENTQGTIDHDEISINIDPGKVKTES